MNFLELLKIYAKELNSIKGDLESHLGASNKSVRRVTSLVDKIEADIDGLNPQKSKPAPKKQ
ncbi:MAG: hypothetical protein WBA57_16140 [Elainellaceae cyanobacterium]